MATTVTNELATTVASHDDAAVRPGFFRRLYDALVEARHRAAEREIERYIMNHGGVLTDRLEQDLSRTFGGPAGRVD